MMAVVWVAAAAVVWLGAAMSLVLTGKAAAPFVLMGRALGVGFYSAIISPPMFWLLRRVRRLLGMVESYRIG